MKTNEEANQDWQTRMIASVSKLLGVSVTLRQWQRKSNGMDVPVFNVPETHRSLAIQLGLSV